MTILDVVAGYVRVCKKFGFLLNVSDGVLYFFRAGERIGYLTENMMLAGQDRELKNAYGLLRELMNLYSFRLSFKRPGSITILDGYISLAMAL